MSLETTTLIMNDDQTFTHSDDGYLPAAEWGKLHNVAERSVKRWLGAEEIPGAEQRGPKKQWFIPATAMRLNEQQRAERAAEKAAAEAEEEAHTAELVIVPTAELATTEIELEIDEEFADHLWHNDLEFYLARMPAHIPVRLGAAMLGLGVGYVKNNPDKFEIIHRGGPNQTDVMPKAVILKLIHAQSE